MVPKKKVFLDASVFIAASGSISGGSSLILEVCKGKYFTAVTTRKILQEAQKNIRKKLPSESLLQFYKEMGSLKLKIVDTPQDLSEYDDVISARDQHVLAGAISGKASFLITLDRKHFFTEEIKNAKLPVTIMTPKEFLEFIRERNFL